MRTKLKRKGKHPLRYPQRAHHRLDQVPDKFKEDVAKLHKPLAAYWFHEQIHVEEYPWAFKNGDSKRRIAALDAGHALPL